MDILFAKICNDLYDASHDNNIAVMYRQIFSDASPPVFSTGDRGIARVALNPKFRMKLVAVMPFAMTLFTHDELQESGAFQFYVDSFLGHHCGIYVGCAPDIWVFDIEGNPSMSPGQVVTALVEKVQAATKLLREAGKVFS